MSTRTFGWRKFRFVVGVEISIWKLPPNQKCPWWASRMHIARRKELKLKPTFLQESFYFHETSFAL
jgi:hypothetical protein